MSNPLLEQARKGDPSAIAQLLSNNLTHKRNKRIAVKANRKGTCLHLLLLGKKEPTDRDKLVAYIHAEIRKLVIEDLTELQIDYCLKGKKIFLWSESRTIGSRRYTVPAHEPLGLVFGVVVAVGAAVCAYALLFIPVVGAFLGIIVFLVGIVCMLYLAISPWFLSGPCPHCGTENVTKVSSGFTCCGCQRRVRIEDKRFYRT